MASRSTFRPASEGIAWQKQLRDRHLSDGVPPVPHLDVRRAVVRPVSRRLAEQIILKYEWLGTMAPTSRHYGIFFGSYCAGVCCVAGSEGTAGTRMHEEFGIGRHELAILSRGACTHWAPPGANSRLVAWTCRLLRKDTPWRVVVAYSDSEAGEVGTIYQACNWAFIGVTHRPNDAELLAPNGRIYNGRHVGHAARANGVRWAVQRRAFQRAGWRFQPSNPKGKYAYVLDRSDKALVDRVERMRQSYPKRLGVRSVDGNAPAGQAGDGGSTPTRTLQEVTRG